MSLVLDHFFILVEPGAPQADLLLDLGMNEGAPNDHPGQGTANRRFFFRNSMLELLFVRDADEAERGPGAAIDFVKRAQTTGASPFGLVMRSDPSASDPPFAAWNYFPDYLDGDRHFCVGKNSDAIQEPLCFYIPFEFAAPTSSVEPDYAFRELTGVRLTVPSGQLSAVAESLNAAAGLQLQTGDAHLLSLRFNDGQCGRSADLRPRLPLELHW